MSLLQDHENECANVVSVVTGSWEVKESELLLLNHEKCGRQRIWNSHRYEIKLLQLLRGS